MDFVGAFPDGHAHRIEHPRRVGEFAQPIVGARQQGDIIRTAFALAIGGLEGVAGTCPELAGWLGGVRLVRLGEEHFGQVARHNGVRAIQFMGLGEIFERRLVIAIECECGHAQCAIGDDRRRALCGGFLPHLAAFGVTAKVEEKMTKIQGGWAVLGVLRYNLTQGSQLFETPG